MNPLTILWRLLSTDEIARLGSQAAKLDHDGDALASRVQRWLVDGADIIADARKANQADLVPLLNMLKGLSS